MSMDPSDSDNAVVYLSLKQPHLVCHVAVVGGALLPRNHKRVYDESIVFLDTAKNSAELKFVFCVQPCNLKKMLDYLNRANYCFELSFLWCRLRLILLRRLAYCSCIWILWLRSWAEISIAALRVLTVLLWWCLIRVVFRLVATTAIECWICSAWLSSISLFLHRGLHWLLSHRLKLFPRWILTNFLNKFRTFDCRVWGKLAANIDCSGNLHIFLVDLILIQMREQNILDIVRKPPHERGEILVFLLFLLVSDRSISFGSVLIVKSHFHLHCQPNVLCQTFLRIQGLSVKLLYF